MTHWTDAIHHARQNKAAGGDWSDADVAYAVRMLTREQLDHEAICTVARNRIARLSYENACLRYYVEKVAAYAIDDDVVSESNEALTSIITEARGKLEHIDADQQGLFTYAEPATLPASAPSEVNSD